MKASVSDLVTEKHQNEALQQLHQQQSRQQQDQIDRLERENGLLKHQLLAQKETAELQIEQMQLQVKQKEAIALQLEVSNSNIFISRQIPPPEQFRPSDKAAGVTDRHAATIEGSSSADSNNAAATISCQFSAKTRACGNAAA